MSEAAIEEIVTMMQVLGEPTRIRIVELLERREATVQEITDHLESIAQTTSHQNVSKHLRWLHSAGLVGRRKEGNHVRYRLIDWTGCWLIRQVGESIAARLEELQGAIAPAEGLAPEGTAAPHRDR